MTMVPEQPPRPESSGHASAGSGPASQRGADQSAPVIPDYELLRRIGRGAYGEVWLARNITGSFVAVKIVSRGAFDHDRPFEREFEGIKRFEPISRSDPSQVAILHVGRGEGLFYYVMELADPVESPKSEGRDPKKTQNRGSETESRASGFSLSSTFDFQSLDSYVPHTLREDLKRHGRLPAGECGQIGLGLTRALAHLHRCGLVHRDVKASNVIFVGGVPKLADIGLVASVDATRSLVGTEGYVAPEGPGTPQADLYSLGKLLYEISTGCDRKEFPALPADVATRSDRTALIELNAIVTRACQFDPAQRYARAEAMLAELELVQRGHSVQRNRMLQKCWKTGLKATATIVASAVLIAVAVFLVQRSEPSNVSSDRPRTPDSNGPPSTNSIAMELCEKAWRIIRNDQYDQFPQAYSNFHAAASLDTKYVRPYVGLLLLRTGFPIPSLGNTSPEELRQIASKLQLLGPGLPATYDAQSFLDWADWNYPQALSNALEAVRTGPEQESSHNWYAVLLTMCGRLSEARKELTDSANISSFASAKVYRIRGQTYYFERKFTEAIAWERKALGLDPHETVALYTIGCAYQTMGDYSNAIYHFELEDINGWGDTPKTRKRYEQLRRALDAGGQKGYWQEKLNQTTDTEFYRKAQASIHLGDTNAALTWLEKSCAEHERWPGSFYGPLAFLLLDADWDPVHDDPRFKAVVDKIGFTKVSPREKL